MSKRKPSKIWILSDIHNEHHETEWHPENYPEHDILVAAGDIAGSAIDGVDFLARLTDKPVIYVLGNHEFHGGDWNREIEEARMESLKYPNIFFLEDGFVQINDINFIGSTLWTDFNLHQKPDVFGALVENTFIDFKNIQSNKKRLKSKQWRERHAASEEFIERMLDTFESKNCVVVTHHAPHEKSIYQKYQTDPRNPCFISHKPELVEKANLWIHGHVHNNFDYNVKNCRVICNPYGYDHENQDFKENLVIEI